jgi:hypothetical protein
LYFTTAGESLVDYTKHLLSLQDEALATVEQVEIAKVSPGKLWSSQMITDISFSDESLAFCPAMED